MGKMAIDGTSGQSLYAGIEDYQATDGERTARSAEHPSTSETPESSETPEGEDNLRGEEAHEMDGPNVTGDSDVDSKWNNEASFSFGSKEQEETKKDRRHHDYV